jgi:hypothetical protein
MTMTKCFINALYLCGVDHLALEKSIDLSIQRSFLLSAVLL